MLKNRIFKLLLLALLFAGLGGCNYDNLAELYPTQCDATSTVSYSNDIVLILKSNCGTGNTCHGSNNTSGITLNSYSGVKAQVDNSKLLSSITWDGNASFMPSGSTAQIDTCSIGKISRWIANGAPNN
ncbi:MAG: hypothetical protein K9J37_19410 [Saprospiraceae bacterium]|nr:hypothetical protein [Saprospiraceae bacterium]MCF8252094.1 hypothetical protein [Saprospiraceae bacterium]MCF8283214.1 hypothetical protein [Bacteroidales bacterium]MCF8313737.1 hypothetical protein [Saprospiraceae bacterium]MCF8442455.1 hypothetical protein [Saprospiraceae bacterium]